MCVSEPVLSQDCKNDIFMRCLKMLKIAIWKNDLIYGYRFWAMFAKHRYIHLKFGMPDVQAWFYNILYVVFRKNLEILDFVKSYIQILFFFYFLGDKIIFWRIRDSRFEELLSVRLLLLYISILLKISIFGDFSNINFRRKMA